MSSTNRPGCVVRGLEKDVFGVVHVGALVALKLGTTSS